MHIRDPYAVPGAYRKAQLHCHTRRSDGRFEPADLARRYRDAGYAFVCFTDHDTVTRADELNDDDFLALPGVEETIVRGLLPLGPHLGRLLVDDVLGRGSAGERVAATLRAGGVPCLHHPSWTGNLGTGAWSARAMAALPGPFLVEIWNPHSDTGEDVRRWAHTAAARGPDARITAIAGDDCHVGAQFNRGWVMVKVPEVSVEALRTALLTGACYASTGIDAEFGTDGAAVVVQSTADEVRVIAADDTLRATIRGGSGRYAPAGDEGFVRLECRAGHRRAWSQVFWIAP
ncbi:MAG: hypothetical protein K6W08_15785 [Firmicutes bacterium]|nr:hypothetical protein [Bacillota bacterium]